jgi:septal ring factor EnvC (AmiA/AmiB activator)
MTNADGVALAYDFKTGAAESRARLVASPLPKNWDGPAPSLSVAWKGQVDSPARDIDAGSYYAALTALAVAREQARIEAFEADVRERQAFSRRLKGLEFLRRRDDEIAAFEAERERLAREEERRKAEEERLEAERVAKARADAERQRQAAEARAAAEAARIEAERRLNASPSVPPPLDIAPMTRPAAGVVAPPGQGDPSAAGRY